MKKRLLRVLLLPCMSLVCSCGAGTSSVTSSSSAASSETPSSSEAASSEAPSSEESSSLSKQTLFVLGDSTVCDFPTETYYYRRYGYGTQLDQYFDSTNLTVNNLALSGRSSKSYILESNYTTFTTSITKGDYLLLGFGHNDEKAEAARYTDPNGDYKTEGSFAYELYTYYIKIALDAGAYPILCTPICRYNSSGNYAGSSAHITADSGTYKGGDYPAAIRTLGETLSLPVIDLTAETKALYTSADLTDDDVKHLFAWTTPTVMYDTTHTSIWGAKYNAYFIAKDIQTTASSLKNYVKADIAAPTRAADLTVNPNYVESSTGDGSFTASTLYTTVKEPWYGTGMGNLGGVPSVANLDIIGNIVETDEANIAITAGNPETAALKGGKISSSADGFLMGFQSKDLDNDYEIKGQMTIDALPGDGVTASSLNQIGFGLMMRGDIQIDTQGSVATNYVAAGFYYSGSGANLNGPYMRKDAKLDNGTAAPAASIITEGAAFDVSIKKYNTLADGTATYDCTVGTYTSTFTVNLKSGTSNKIFIGCFAARCAKVSFSSLSIVNQN